MTEPYAVALTAQDLSGPAWQAFIGNAAKAEAQVASLHGSMGQLGRMADQTRTAFYALGGAWVADKLVGFHNEVQETTARLKSHADAVGLTTDQLQAYQVAARAAGVPTELLQRMLGTFNGALGQAAAGEKTAADAFINLGVRILDANGHVRDNSQLLTESSRALLAIEDPGRRAATATALFGREGKQATPVLREFADGIGTLTDKARAAGQLIDRETIATFNRLQTQSDEARVKIQALYAQMAAPIQASAMSWFAQQMQEVANSIALIGTHQGVLDQIMEIVNLMGGGLGGRIAGQDATSRALLGLADFEKKVVAERQELARVMDTTVGVEGTIFSQKDIDDQTRRVAQAEASLVKAQNIYRQFAMAKGLQPSGPAGQQFGPPIDLFLNHQNSGNRYAQPTATGRDRIGEEMQQLVGNVDAARTAYEQLKAAAESAVSTTDLERQVALQKQISDELARIGKYAKDDPRVPQIRALVTAHEGYQYQLKMLEQALKVADEAEKQFGDGTAELTRRQLELAQALATRRLGDEAFSNAMIAAKQAQVDQSLKAHQYAVGLEGVAAGWEFAAVQAARASSSFNTGGQIFQSTMSLMDQALNDFVQNGQVNFGKLLSSFLLMIAQMQLKLAASQLSGLLFGATGGGGGLIGGGIANILGGGSWGSGAAGVGSSVPDFIAAGGAAFADGGRPPVGVPSIVGERGRELFVPDQPGTILNQDQLAGMGGVTVALSMSNHFGSDVSRAEMTNWAATIERRARDGAIAGILSAKASGGAARKILKR